MGAARPEADGPRPTEGGQRLPRASRLHRSSEGGQRLPRASRLHRSSEIRGLFERGKRKRTAHLDVFFAASPASRPRLAVLVPKHRHTVVERNRLKRRLRELGRTRVLPALRAARQSVDVMVRARREAYQASVAQLRDELDGVVELLCSGPSSSR